MLALAFLVHGFHARRRLGWFFLAGAALAMAVGARPSYVVGGIALPMIALGLWWIGRTQGSWRWIPVWNWWADVAVLGGSFAAIVGALLFYNYARFHNPLEFGLNYQLTGTVESRVKHFSLSFMPFNGYIYFLAPAQWGRYFPFVQLIRPPAAPQDYYGIEYPYGVLTNMPLTMLAFLWPLGILRRGSEGRRSLSVLGIVLTTFFIAMGAFLCGFVTGAQRYMSDFTPSLVLLGCLGLLGAERALEPLPPWLRRIGCTSLGFLSAFSIFFGVMTSFQLHGLFRINSPEVYASVARAFNMPVFLWEKATGFKYGPLEITLKFPHGRTGKIEPLVSTGWEFYSDHLFVIYLDDHTVRLGFDHISHGTKISAPLELDFDTVHKIRVEMGSLYPPGEHPYYSGMTELEKASLLRWLKVVVDGKPAIETTQAFYDASPESISIGKASATHAYGERFSGTVLSVKRGDFRPLSEPRGVYGSIVLQLFFPRNVAGHSHPLVTTGVTGKADVLYVRYISDDVVRFGYDHWGIGMVESGDVPIQHDIQQRLEIRMPALMRETPSPYTLMRPVLLVQLDDQVVWATQVAAHASSPSDISIGRNSAGSSVCEPEFTGMITSVSRERELVEPETRDTLHARVRLLLAKGRPGTRDPLFVRGRAGAADLLYVEYIDGSHVRFGWDHWGVGGTMSQPISVDYTRIHDIEASFHPDLVNRSLVLSMDGVEVLVGNGEVYPASPESVMVGLNRIGASTCGEAFNGAIVSVQFPDTKP
ncbi:hypothetical protein DB347_14830 [Opitutaceae bacterium EW11]|nr:hypothetical protein DB347_14830 [Opitutaceae bacterium EW11]